MRDRGVRDRRVRKPHWAAAVLSAALVSACSSSSEPDLPRPPRVTTEPQLPERVSTVVVPVTLSLAAVQRSLEARVPHQLWSINEHRDKCVPGQRIKAFGAKLKVTPDLGCQIVGRVVRGPLRLSGSGRRIMIAMPVSATISARDVGGVLKGKTASGSAIVNSTALLDMSRDWTPTARLAIAYDWTDPPGIDFLGQRILFVQRADKELAKVIKGLERDFQAEIGKVALKPLVEQAWRKGFTVVELNGRNPPVWMRVTPLRAGVLDYRIAGGAVILTVAAKARTETFVGRKPAEPPPTPLPPQLGGFANTGLSFNIPVLADYDQLEPVVLRALRRLAGRGIDITGLGRVDARFRKVTVFATEHNRLAVGIDAQVEPRDTHFGIGKTRGEVWLTGEPVQQPDSEVIRIRNLAIFGATNRTSANLLMRLVLNDAVNQEIAASLTQDFTKDYNRVLTSAKRAIADKQIGDFVLAAQVNSVHHDLVRVTGAGLFLPVEVSGTARLDYRPQTR